jgi:hypothetical protein
MLLVRKEMNLKDIKEVTEELVRSGIVHSGLLVYKFSFEVPKILEDFVDSMKNNIYRIAFRVNLPLNIDHDLAYFGSSYFLELKELVQISEIVDTRYDDHLDYIDKKVVEISVLFLQISRFSDLLVPIEKTTYQGFYNLFYSKGGGIFSVHIEDFLIDYDYYGKVL